MPVTDVPPDPPVLAQQQSGSFDLRDVKPREAGVNLSSLKPRCAPASGNEIVVCAPDPEKNRLRPLPETYAQEEGLPRAAVGISEGATLDLHVDSAAMPDGTVSNRLMVGLKIGF